ncbi:MAG: hypothetical protein K8H88_11120, partial [Sandaracinaceae bacterium]|nr:hypothetical protein [Sandaracinaceae bacterium]
TLGDINSAIGEFGQRKVDEMQEDARNEQGLLRRVVDFLLNFCLEDRNSKVNAFLVRAAASRERSVIATLSDLRLLHLIHQSITPDRAGETYQAYILDYSLFTGFRRKRNVTEMLPDEGEQFKATALRQLPKLPTDFLRDVEPSSSGTVDSPARGEEADDRAKPLVPSTGAPQARRRRRTTGASRKSARKRTKTAKGSAKQAGKKK